MEKDNFTMWIKPLHTAWLTLLLSFGFAAWSRAETAPATDPDAVTNVIAAAQAELDAARGRCRSEPTNSVAAWELGRACFAWGKLLKDPKAQEGIYSEGATACRRSIALASNAAPAHYYLGMNVGRVANLKRNLSAFGLVKEVEREFHLARKLDEKFGYGGPDRNLGLLYWHAPGWPVSVGDKKLARQHLKRAVELAPEYPENRLNLAEAYLDWKETALARSEIASLEKIWSTAQTNLVGIEWEWDWADWSARRQSLRLKLAAK